MKNGNFYYTPHFNTENLPVNFYGRLRKIGKPIIFVGGTSSKQGKFNLQLELRKFFLEEGIKVGQLGTEPSSLLFGFEEVFPIGYNSTVHLDTEEMAVAANYLISKIEDQDPDLIIIGAQGFMLSNNYSHRQQNDFINIAMLWSCQADSVLLMINESDSIEYIKRTISFLESYVNTNVLCLVLSPTTKVITTVFGGIVTDPNNENTEIIYLIEQGTGKKVFKFNQISEIGETCIKYFTD